MADNFRSSDPYNHHRHSEYYNNDHLSDNDDTDAKLYHRTAGAHFGSDLFEEQEVEQDGSPPCNFEPVWAGAVGQKGDVFYVEGSQDSQPQHPSDLSDSPLLNGKDKDEHDESSRKTGIKQKVKGFIGSKKTDTTRTINNHVDTNHIHSTHHGVTFRDTPTGLIKDVLLFVDPNRHNYGRRATLCESLFGIIPGHFNHVSTKSAGVNGQIADRRIMVQGLIPQGEAAKSANVKIGDWLMQVNDLEVTFDNFDSILSAITSPKQVKLTVQKLAVETIPQPTVMKKNVNANSDLVKLVSGQTIEKTLPAVDSAPYLVLYLTMNCHSDNMLGQEDIVYQYPCTHSKLIDIRGMFITLSHMLVDVTNNTARNSTVLVDSRLLHVGYSRESKEVLVMAVPADRLSVFQLNHVVEDVVRLCKVLYGSLGSAFGAEDNKDRLDHFFSLLFKRVLQQEQLVEGLGQGDGKEPLYDVFPGARLLTLPDQTKVTVTNCLSELEAADFTDMSDEYYDCRRSYTIQGCCLLYKGYLIANHLHREDLQDVCLYCQYHCLLTLSNQEQMGQVVVWKEVFPWRRCHALVDPLIPGYTEPDARWFLLAVGLKNSLLCMVLEAGGCASWVEGHPTPDPFYVDQAKATLLQLEAADVPNQCQIRLSSPAVPSLASADWYVPSGKVGRDDSAGMGTPNLRVQASPKIGVSPTKKLLQPESILKKKAGALGESQRQLAVDRGAAHEVESDADSQSTGHSESSSTPVMDRRGRKTSAESDESIGSGSSLGLFKAQRRRRNMLSAYNLSGIKKSQGEGGLQVDGSLVKLTAGCDNTLFHYVKLDSLQGVYICPSQAEVASVKHASHATVLRNFHQACLNIRKMFEHSMLMKDMQDKGVPSRMGFNNSLGDVIEHGILFQCTPDNWSDLKKSPPVMTYWVIGRIFRDPFPREFYVCFHDSAQQNIIELAFRLGFGILP